MPRKNIDEILNEIKECESLEVIKRLLDLLEVFHGELMEYHRCLDDGECDLCLLMKEYEILSDQTASR